MKKSVFLALLCSMVIHSACAAIKPEIKILPAGPAPVAKDIGYVAGSTGPGHLLDVYSMPHEGLEPVVVVIHGGGWIGVISLLHTAPNQKHGFISDLDSEGNRRRLQGHDRLPRQAVEKEPFIIITSIASPDFRIMGVIQFNLSV